MTLKQYYLDMNTDPFTTKEYMFSLGKHYIVAYPVTSTCINNVISASNTNERNETVHTECDLEAT